MIRKIVLLITAVLLTCASVLAQNKEVTTIPKS